MCVCVGQHVGLDALGAEQLIYDQSYNDLINSFGIEIDYYINTTDLIGADMLYGEQPTAIYYGPIPIKMYIEIENEILFQVEICLYVRYLVIYSL